MDMMPRLPSFVRRWGVLLVLSVLVGCARGTSTPVFAPPGPGPAPLASPLELSPFASPIPSREMQGAVVLVRNPTPEPGLASVQGILSVNGQAGAGQTLYLAPMIHEGGESLAGVAALDPVRDPRAESDGSGYFAFLRVRPGRYALGILSPAGPVLINRDGQEIIVEAEANHIADLQTVHIVPFGQ